MRTPTGPLTLFGVHLRSPTTPRRGAYRDRQLDLLEELLAAQSGPVAVMGDFNVTPYSPFYADWLAKTGLTDTRRGRTLSPSWPTYLPAPRNPDRSLRREPRRHDRRASQLAELRLRSLSDPRGARFAGAARGDHGRHESTMSQPTACILVIGNEILSGKTQDANIQFLGFELAKLGIRLEEARVVRDVPPRSCST